MHITAGLNLGNFKSWKYTFAPQERHLPPDRLIFYPSYLITIQRSHAISLPAFLLILPMAVDLHLDASASWQHHNPTKNYSYSPSLASTASSSSSSVFSLDAPSSQSSVSSSAQWASSAWNSENESENQVLSGRHISRKNNASSSDEAIIITPSMPCSRPRAQVPADAVAPESRQHPRRTQRLNSYESHDLTSVSSCPRPPPSLVRQSERKENFVDSLVGKLTCWTT